MNLRERVEGFDKYFSNVYDKFPVDLSKIYNGFPVGELFGGEWVFASNYMNTVLYFDSKDLPGVSFMVDVVGNYHFEKLVGVDLHNLLTSDVFSPEFRDLVEHYSSRGMFKMLFRDEHVHVYSGNGFLNGFERSHLPKELTLFEMGLSADVSTLAQIKHLLSAREEQVKMLKGVKRSKGYEEINGFKQKLLDEKGIDIDCPPEHYGKIVYLRFESEYLDELLRVSDRFVFGK